jgi:hypothetical protein
MKTKNIWVIEMLCIDSSWQPTVGAALSYAEVKDELLLWKSRNPDDSFRVSKYGKITK